MDFLGFLPYRFVARVGLGGRRGPTIPTRFDEVAGCDAEKGELMEVVDFLRNPERYHRLGSRIPAGVLLSGPPGTGKTLLARAVAGEAGVPFFALSGSDFVEMFVGVGAARVRKSFARARRAAPCILFIDEIDAVGRARGGGGGGTHEERDQTLNQILVEMDGFHPNTGVIVIAATNRLDSLDKALLRPGRFTRQVVLSVPDLGGRRRILDVHAAGVPLAAEVDLGLVARGTPGFTGAELANLINEATIVAARQCRGEVTMADFELAKDRLLMGNERPGLAMKDEDRRLIAIHEAGHALVALHCPAADPIHKATILPRGQTLGAVVRLPDGDNFNLRRSRLEADLAVAMGGRAAERLVFGADGVSTGASGDLRMATGLARRMSGEWGMGRANGLMWRAAAGEPGWVEDPGCVDEDVRALLDAAMRRAEAILESHRPELLAVADALIDREVLNGSEISAIARSALKPISTSSPTRRPSRPPAVLPSDAGSARYTSWLLRRLG